MLRKNVRSEARSEAECRKEAPSTALRFATSLTTNALIFPMPKETMSSKERWLAVLYGEVPDRLACSHG
jgi:hypothetical protein